MQTANIFPSPFAPNGGGALAMAIIIFIFALTGCALTLPIAKPQTALSERTSASAAFPDLGEEKKFVLVFDDASFASTYTIQYSFNLRDWTDDNNRYCDSPGTFSITSSIPIDAHSVIFFRIRAQLTPPPL